MMELHYIAVLLICFTTNSLGTAPRNLALRKPSGMKTEHTTHPEHGVLFHAGLVNDGDLGTKASTNNDKKNWWYVDLGERINVTFILIKMDSDWLNLDIGVSDNRPNKDRKPNNFKVCKNFKGVPDERIQRIECSGKVGQYVIIFSDTGTTKSHLRITEVEVYNTSDTPKPGSPGISQINLARNKTSGLSSTDGNYEASNGNDGEPYSEARTDANAPLPAFWWVDLEERYQFLRIIFYHIGNGTGYEWKDLYIGVGDNPPTKESVPGKDFRVCRMYDSRPMNAMQDVNCHDSGRYVILFSNKNPKFRIREVEIYEQGMTPENIALKKTSMMKSPKLSNQCIPYFGNDGNLATLAFGGEWWRLDLDEVIHVAYVVIKIEQPWRLSVGVSKGDSVDNYYKCREFYGFTGDWIQTIMCSRKGRYVKLTNQEKDKKEMRIVEVEVYNNQGAGSSGIARYNLARNKPSGQSSNQKDTTPASNGNDGDPTTAAITDPDTYPAFWYVDLGAEFQVTHIIAYAVGKKGQLNVGVGDEPPTTETQPEHSITLCGTTLGPTEQPWLEYECCEAYGRYVIVHTKYYNLRIRELEVFSNPKSGSFCKTPKNLALKKISRQNHVEGNANIGWFVSYFGNDGDLSTWAIIAKGPYYWTLDLNELVYVKVLRVKIEQPWDDLYVGLRKNEKNDNSLGNIFVCKNFTEFPGDWIQEILCQHHGRFVTIYSGLESHPLRVVEVEVFNTAEPGKDGIGRLNLARKKMSVQSSTLDNNTASNANDGNPRSEAITEPDSFPAYLYVDLAGQYEVTFIIMYRKYRPNNVWKGPLYVGVGDKPPTNESIPGDDFGLCRTFHSKPQYTLDGIHCNLNGRYVIFFSHEMNLEFREVEVYSSEPLRSRFPEAAAPGASGATKAPSSAGQTVASQGVPCILLETAIMMCAFNIHLFP